MKTAIHSVVTLLAGLLLVSSAAAIERSLSGAGEYLIVPFAIASSEYDTLIEVSDTTGTSAPRALKLRILDRDGQPRLTGNLYLKPNATWAAGLTGGGAGQARLLTGSTSCLVIQGETGVEAASDVTFDFTAGSVELVEMGVANGDPLESHILQQECDQIAELWNGSSWDPETALTPPAGDLAANARVLNVPRGAIYHVPVTALAEFSDIVQHRMPGSARPDLSATHDTGTASGETRSTVCSEGGCVTDTWQQPIDAASAALMGYTARDTYEIADSLAALGEWVLTYPTRAYYASSNPFSSADVSLLVIDRNGDKLLGSFAEFPEDPNNFDESTAWLSHDRSVATVDLKTTNGEIGSTQASALFGLSHTVQSPGQDFESLPANGQIRLGFEPAQSPKPPLESNSGRLYWGFPVIVTTFTEYTNGVLEGSDGVMQRANYGSSGSPTTRVRIDPP